MLRSKINLFQKLDIHSAMPVLHAAYFTIRLDSEIFTLRNTNLVSCGLFHKITR
uniref:Uncharacterized protein n=1 Tax=Rhizophora mucronata TaxID=61149 RepID=A0A2P2JF15_RHIMU